jgi:hypothetical protein
MQLLGGTPCTPLLATMWAKEIGVPLGGSKPRAVTSLMDSYVRRLLLPAANGNEIFVNQLTTDATKIAERELGDQYRPRAVSERTESTGGLNEAATAAGSGAGLGAAGWCEVPPA